MTSKDFFEEAKYEWCASEHQDKPLLNDMMRFAKLYHKEQLILSGVSQQREQLLAYHRYLTEELSLDLHEIWVDEYLKSQ